MKIMKILRVFVKRFRLCLKSKSDESMDSENIGKTSEGELEESVDPGSKESDPNGVLEEEEEDDDDDFITNEVKRRLKELRKNSFMVLIPEESCLEEEETSSSEWRESDIEDAYHWPGFTSLHSCYCERMLFFDKLILQHLEEADSWNISNRSPKIATKKLALSFKSLSFKRQEEIQGKEEHDCLPKIKDSHCKRAQNLETLERGLVSLSNETLIVTQVYLSYVILLNSPVNNHSLQEWIQFLCLLLRFPEIEGFEPGGSRHGIHSDTVSIFSKMLVMTYIQGSDHKENDNEDVDSPVLAQQLLKLMEVSILTFRCFLKRDKSKANNLSNLINGHDAITLHQLQTSLATKEAKLKELSKKKGWTNSWPATSSEAELLLALIDVQVVQRVLRMARISKEKLLWCDEKVSKLDLSGNKLVRNGSPILFPR
ncbi:hypothetical protein KSP40_PGU021568 [Platanthera guangdongensis]|uniref:Uncharacterized protein n=1 Tax=Platanthera guangdongensis TaxID=2320717 RepID=A0ABR2LGS8_9ASPA